ncbi:hypothetical protein [Microcoleus sp. bin38.metabat.b11b12b14.051]|nr:hypothetical protein [Microcoleus sp. bin38.metabat.b11b12b14.051]
MRAQIAIAAFRGMEFLWKLLVSTRCRQAARLSKFTHHPQDS